MGNMSYCRFQNTVGDLEDCLEALENDETDEMSYEEARAAKRLVETCKNIVDLDLDMDDIVARAKQRDGGE